MLLDDLTDLISSQSGGTFVSASNLFAGHLPEAPDVATVLYESGGRPHAPVKTMATGPNTSVVEWPRVQVVCRALEYDYATARSNAHAVFKLLDGMPTRSINSVNYKWSTALQSPFLMGRDKQGRVLIATNYELCKEVSP